MYIDTPVKRYSSGMYVRLAFAVAAHLEPEILIVDEVLAVGDAEFQKKCLGKMGDVASHGRTIIFVSHNMAAVQSLCKSAIYLKAGKVADMGRTDKVINNYLSKEVRNCMSQDWGGPENAPWNEFIKMVSAKVIPDLSNETDIITIATRLVLKFEFINYTDNNSINLSLFLNTSAGGCIFNLGAGPKILTKGQTCYSELEIPGNFLNDDIYTIDLLFVKDSSRVIFSIEDLLTFEVFDEERQGNWYGKWPGAVRPALKFTLT